jgi:hypothetical protein
MDHADLANRFTYHPPGPGQAEVYEELRARAHEFALYLGHVCPESREKSLAVTHLEECVMWGNAAIARHSKPMASPS